MLNHIWRISLLLLLAFAATVNAGQERYDYDVLGRLIRYINPAGQATEYIYDAVGNILAVRRGEVKPPQITGVAPGTVRRNTTTAVVVSGTDLFGATVTATDPGLHITGLRPSGTTVSFDLLADETVSLGAQPFSLSFSTGTAAFSLTVRPALPQIIVAPSPVVLAPGETVPLAVSLSNADQEDHRVALTVGDPAVAAISAAALDFPAGQTEATVTVTAVGRGNSFVDLIAAALAPARSGIHVPEDGPPGDRMRIANFVGVIRETVAPAPQPVGPFLAPNVGVFKQN
jgi:YD repeat-containing protein